MDIHVGARLKERRSELGLSQGELAAAVGIRFQQIQKYERGINRISASRLWEIAGVLNVEIAYFFGELPRSEKPIGEDEPISLQIAK